MAIHIEFDETESFEIEIDDIEKEDCLITLCSWYGQALETIEEIKDNVTFQKESGTARDGWIHRCGMKIAYLKKGARALEQRILSLGGQPPYPLNDGRAKHIRNLENKLNRAKALLAANGIELDQLEAA